MSIKGKDEILTTFKHISPFYDLWYIDKSTKKICIQN